MLAMVAVAAATAMYWWFPGAVLGAYLRFERREAGLARREVVTSEGTVPYLDGGRGPAVLLLHGFQDNKDTWVAFASRLTDRFRVIIPDLHAHGENHAATDGDYRPDAQARRMAELLDALHVRAAHVAGVSMGGEIAAAFAAHYPARTLSLGLISAAGGRSDTITALDRRILGGDNVFHVDDIRGLDTLIALIGDSGLTLPAIVKRVMVAEYRERNPVWDSVFHQLVGPDVRYETDSLAPEITARTLVLWGDRDPIFHRSIGVELASRLPSATLAILPDCGHLCPATRAAESAARYRQFLLH